MIMFIVSVIIIVLLIVVIVSVKQLNSNLENIKDYINVCSTDINNCTVNSISTYTPDIKKIITQENNKRYAVLFDKINVIHRDINNSINDNKKHIDSSISIAETEICETYNDDKKEILTAIKDISKQLDDNNKKVIAKVNAVNKKNKPTKIKAKNSLENEKVVDCKANKDEVK